MLWKWCKFDWLSANIDFPDVSLLGEQPRPLDVQNAILKIVSLLLITVMTVVAVKDPVQ